MTGAIRAAKATGMAAAITLATASAGWAQTAWDPLESLNRAIWNLNGLYISAVYTPTASFYQDVVPAPVRTGIDNVFTNLREPVTTIGSAIAGDFRNAGISAGRFAINLTAGLGGVFDVATEMGWVAAPMDIGTALCRRGVPAGPYLVLPIIGSIHLRDGAGLAAAYGGSSMVLQDWTLPYIIADRSVARLTDPNGFSDDYAMQRDAYWAFREALCAGTLPADTLKASPFGQTIPMTAEIEAPVQAIEAPAIELPEAPDSAPPADEPPVSDLPAAEPPSEEVPLNDTRAGEAPTGAAPAGAAPGSETPGSETLDSETPAAEGSTEGSIAGPDAAEAGALL